MFDGGDNTATMLGSFSGTWHSSPSLPASFYSPHKIKLGTETRDQKLGIDLKRIALKGIVCTVGLGILTSHACGKG